MTAPGPLLSVVIVCRNQLNSLKFTMATLRDQAPAAAHEIIVVDQGSTDGSAQFLSKLADNPRLRLVNDDTDEGRSAARNRGARASRGRFIVFLDPGMVLGPHWAEALVDTLEKDPLVGATAGKVILQDGRIDHAGLAVIRWDQPRRPRLSGRSLHAGRQADFGASLRPLAVQGLSGEAICVRASAFFAVGGFDEGMGREFARPKPMAEGEPAGLDLCLRLGARGWLCVYRPETVMTRLRAAENDPDADARRYELTANDDQVLLTATWLGRARPDFVAPAAGGAVAQDHGGIRSWVEPGIAFAYGDYHHGRSPGSPVSGVLAPVASVIVPTCNALDYTRLCVESLLTNTDVRHELIFVDNGSTDGTPEYLQGLARDHKRVRVILNGDNLGFARGCNLGLAAAHGRHLVLLNSDTVVTGDWLERLLKVAEANPRAGLVGPVTNNISGLQKLESVGYDEESLAGLGEFAAAEASRHDGEIERTLRLTGMCLLIKRELLARIGGLDEIFGLGNYEDNDYCLRAHLAGYECLVARGAFIHHFGSRSFAAAGIDYLAQIRRQWSIFKAKWGIPAETPFNGNVEMGALLAGGFDPERHFQPLPAEPAAGTGAGGLAAEPAACGQS
jgi:GT2 family glycosyltransferase